MIAVAPHIMELGDIRVAFDVAGDGLPVVLVHGLAEDRRSWSCQMEHLTGVHLHAYDLRGHGRTTLGRADGTLAQLGGDLVRFLEGVTGRAAVVGFSLGGTVALWAAARRPDLLRQVAVLGTSSIVGSSAARFYAQRIELVSQGDRNAIRATLVEDTAAALYGTAKVAAVVDRRLDAIGDGEGYSNAARAMVRLNREPLTPLLSGVRCHVDVVGGEHDRFCPKKAADILLSSLSKSTYHELADVGHLMNVDAPQAVTLLLQDLLKRAITP